MPSNLVRPCFRSLKCVSLVGELPEGRHLRVENKNFYFDIGQNNRGIYMRISEVIRVNSIERRLFNRVVQVKTNYRTAVTIPEKSWARFRDIFSDYVDKMKEATSSSSGGAGGQQPAAPSESSPSSKQAAPSS